MDASTYSGSLLGTLTVGVLIGVSWLCKNKMKHSRCKFNTKCLEISSREDTLRNTIRDELIEELRRDGIIPASNPKGEVSLV